MSDTARPMSAERIQELRRGLLLHHYGVIDDWCDEDEAIRWELLVEVERQRTLIQHLESQKAMLLELSSTPIISNREVTIMEIVRAMATLGEHDPQDDLDGEWITSHDLKPWAEKARAVLAAGNSIR